jgi:hypothetical protein
LVERTIHEELSEYRFNKRREFFQISLKDAIVKVQEVAERLIKVRSPTSVGWVDALETQHSYSI